MTDIKESNYYSNNLMTIPSNIYKTHPQQNNNNNINISLNNGPNNILNNVPNASLDPSSMDTNHSAHEGGDKTSIWKIYSQKAILVHGEYVLSKILGKGSFGIVHQGFHKDTLEPVAIKLEHIQSKNRILAKEYNTYLQVWSEDAGLPRILASGKKDEYQYIVMEMLGPSLEELLRRQQVFGLKTVLMLADQMIERMRYLHGKGYLHRDIKPENFLMGIRESQDRVHLIDLGLAKRWRQPDGSHIPYISGNKIIGTARYASINSHSGVQLSRRDDMESLGYLLVYFAKGKLPWQSLRSQTKEEKYQQIADKKKDVSIEKLCVNLPKEFILYFKHVKSLAFEEEPCYDYLKSLFLTAFSEAKLVFDYRWDWTL
jgi:serine/threonine protein kinase